MYHEGVNSGSRKSLKSLFSLNLLYFWPPRGSTYAGLAVNEVKELLRFVIARYFELDISEHLRKALGALMPH